MIVSTIRRRLMAAEIQQVMDSVSDELFPPGWDHVGLEAIPVSPQDIWIGIYIGEALAGVAYAIKIGKTPGHNLHVVFGKKLRGKLAKEALAQAGHLFFTNGVETLWTLFPVGNAPWRPARILAGQFGFRKAREGTLPGWDQWNLTAKEWNHRTSKAA